MIAGSVRARAFVGTIDPGLPSQPWTMERALTIDTALLDTDDSPVYSHFYDVAVEPCGDIVVAGFALGHTAWEDKPNDDFAATIPMAGEDIIAARLAPDGTARWERRFQSDKGDVALALATDVQSNVYLGGSYAALVDNVGVDPWEGSMDSDCATENAFLLHLSP